MSKVFYDHIIILEEVEVEINNSVESEEERHELWQIVDEIVHNRVLEFLLDKLDCEHHDHFLEQFHEKPHEESLLDYLNERIEGEIEELIGQELESLSSEILRGLKTSL